MDSNYSGAVALGFNTSAPPCRDLSRLAPLGTAGAASVHLDPESGTARVASASRIEEQGTTDNRESVAAPADQQAIADRKRFSTLRARLALAGYALSRTNETDGAVIYHASRWGMTRALANLADVESFAVRVGAAQ